MRQKINVAVDGTAGSGKSSILKMVAKEVDYELIDTGLMYRAFTYHLFLNKIDFQNHQAVIDSLTSFNFTMKKGEVFLNNDLNITDKLASNDVLENINYITVLSEVRAYMVKLQRELGNKPGVIELGRDITTVVLPDAKLKIYLDAPVEIRAQRRYEQNLTQGIDDTIDSVLEKMQLRDETDQNRKVGALKISDEAWYIDTSLQSIEQTAAMIINKIYQLEEGN